MKTITFLMNRNAMLTCLLIFVSLTSINFSLKAQSLADWESAEQASGIASIPYSDIRSTAQGYVSQRDNYCKTDNANWNGKDPRVLANDVDGMKAKIANLVEQKNGFDKERSNTTDEAAKSTLSGKIKEADDKISELNGKISDFTYRIQNERASIKQAIADAEKCLEARLAIYKAFDRAIEKAGNESDAQIKPLATKMANTWDRGQGGHLEQIDNVRTRIKNLSALL